MSTTTTTKPSAECVGDTCIARDTWPLHHVRHRGELRRLCTSCVLKYHPGSFCCLCFVVLEAPPTPPPVHCSKCSSVCHVSCLQNPNLASQFTCPCCERGEAFSFFAVDSTRRKRIGITEAKVLNAAARLAVGSMSLAANAARAEAERKAKEAGIARKRAREMLEMAIVVSTKEKESTEKESTAEKETTTAAEPEKKKVVVAVVAAPKVDVGTVRRVNNREVDKWLRLHEMRTHAVDVKNVSKVGNVKDGVNCAVSAEKGKKKASSVVQMKEEKVVVGVDSEKGARKPPSSQGCFDTYILHDFQFGRY